MTEDSLRRMRRDEIKADTVETIVAAAEKKKYPAGITILISGRTEDPPEFPCEDAAQVRRFLAYWRFRNLFDQAYVRHVAL